MAMHKSDKAKIELVKWILAAQKNNAVYLDSTAKTASMTVIGSSLFIFGVHNNDLFVGINHSMSDWFYDVPWVRVDIVPKERRFHMVAEMKPGVYFTLIIHDDKDAISWMRKCAEQIKSYRLPFRAFIFNENEDAADVPYHVSEEVPMRIPLRVIERTVRAKNPSWMQRSTSQG